MRCVGILLECEECPGPSHVSSIIVWSREKKKAKEVVFETAAFSPPLFQFQSGRKRWVSFVHAVMM